MSDHAAPYFENHDRKDRFPWSLYHHALTRQLAGAIAQHGESPRVLTVGCGLEPTIPGAPAGTRFYGCDLDERAVAACQARFPEMAGQLAVCPSPHELPSGGAFGGSFDVVLAKEVVEHLDEPAPWAQLLASRVAVGGELILTTPNYGKYSTLPILERTVLEWIAKKDGYTRAHIHPSRFDRQSLARLDVGSGMALVGITVPVTGWTLLGRWQRYR